MPLRSNQDLAEIDPSAILASSRRSTRATVDYASKEAAEKAGLNDNVLAEEAEEGDVTFEEEK